MEICRKYIVAIFTSLIICSCTDNPNFVVTDIVAPANMSENSVQETREELIGTEFNLLFSDNDVRMTVKLNNGKSESYILQKIGDNLYRREDEHEVFDFELNTIFSYIKSCKFTIYKKKRSGSSMVFGGTVILKRQ